MSSILMGLRFRTCQFVCSFVTLTTTNLPPRISLSTVAIDCFTLSASAILFPADKSVQVHEGTVPVSGWAYSGGGRWIERVECSPDGGFTWSVAITLSAIQGGSAHSLAYLICRFQVPFENMSEKHYHTKRLWHMDLPIHAEGWLEIVVRAWGKQPTILPVDWIA